MLYAAKRITVLQNALFAFIIQAEAHMARWPRGVLRKRLMPSGGTPLQAWQVMCITNKLQEFKFKFGRPYTILYLIFCIIHQSLQTNQRNWNITINSKQLRLGTDSLLSDFFSFKFQCSMTIYILLFVPWQRTDRHVPQCSIFNFWYGATMFS